MNKTHPPGQNQIPLASRTQPEIPTRTPETEGQELDSVRKGGLTSGQHGGHHGPMPTGHPSGRTAGRKDDANG